MSSKRSGNWPLRAACAAVLLVSQASLAEPALEEVIVTAQRREQNLQETPISIAAFGEDEIERRRITNIADLAAIVPNLRIVPFGVSPTTLRIYIRGVGVVDSQVTQDPPVGIYLNGVYVARPVGLTLDQAGIERVEVLRGPQGTLYGRNTTGGAINIITKKPGDKLEFSQLVGAGNYNAVRSQTTLSGPLGDKFSAGVSYTLDKRDGWLENTGEGKDFSEYDRDAWRVDLQFRPTDSLTFDYSYDGSQADYTADYYHLTEAALPGAFVPGLPTQPDRLDETTLATPFQGSDDESSGHTLTISADTSVGEFKSITAYREVEANAYNDFSGNTFLTIYRNDPFYDAPAPVLPGAAVVRQQPCRKRSTGCSASITSTSRVARSRPTISLRSRSRATSRRITRRTRRTRRGPIARPRIRRGALRSAAATPRTSATRATTFLRRRLAKTATSRQPG